MIKIYQDSQTSRLKTFKILLVTSEDLKRKTTHKINLQKKKYDK